ncbi:hypothetical protein BH23BAC3_BH23BAC3_10270 [soil metagenome]
MKKVLKIAGISLGVIILVLILFAGTVYFITEQHWNTEYELSYESVEQSDDPIVIDHGRHLLTIRGCFECHGENLAGKIFLEDPVVGRIVATNLTAGKGGIGAHYMDEDYVRAIRKGIKKDGQSVLFMPSHEYAQIHQRDMNAIVSYLRHTEAVDSQLPESKINIPMRAMYLLGGDIALFPARLIDHTVPLPLEEPVTVLEKGMYLSSTCIGCHGRNLSGGKIPGVPPNWPDALNLTPAGSIANWGESEFFKAMRDGITPDGRQLQNEFMPYTMIGQMTDDELHAIFAYFKTLEPVETGVR